ncbi:endo alpha-1,4 polygalactosaminidase [Actinophytocola glycyrrhizae]
MSAVAHLLSAVALLGACTAAPGEEEAIPLPPPHAAWDYQIGGAYDPPDGVEVVGRDHGDDPAAGLYNICYVNAFQAQPGAEDEWGDLLLRDADGDVVYDEDWGEAVLDTSTGARRAGIAAKVNAWVDECADKGFQAVEPDNYDSFTRVPDELLSAGDNQALIRLLSAHAHNRGLAIAQKNTAELAGARETNGLDFAVVEECGHHDGECGRYTEAFGDHVVIVEYTTDGLDRACAGWADELSIVLRDVDVSAPDDEGYVYGTC